MGWTVLYIAFGGVALWLLGEVLLQYKARLRWRLLAFGGFLGVVLGVLIPSVVVIALGAAAFAVGQTYVTLSFRRGFDSGWAVNAPAGLARKRRRPERGRQQPSPEVSGPEAADALHDAPTQLQEAVPAPGAHEGRGHEEFDGDDVFTPARPADAPDAGTTSVYAPQPMPDDSGSYGVYGGDPGYGGDQQPQPAAAQGADQSYGYDYQGYTGQDYGYDNNGQQYAAYSDPYIGTSHGYGGAAYDTGGYAAPGGAPHDPQGYGQDPYVPGTPGTPDGYAGETPPGGVWVPQQRTTDIPYGGDLPPEQQYPYPGDGQQRNQGYDEQQYRF
ncbi:hypothetical protein [Streptomyces sp. SHP 1-2]|uniref:SCO2102 family sporulation regulator n=1 Tax=Streptomyces sp. SHP 1-2 TaxID=2769489 RepID=UPI002237E2DB|nr:hypothetical protein [Streptomyces sp. SHP 1-2]MCW5249290.1 hypothetical protein [Streptomyces sp. SHP 1-2]